MLDCFILCDVELENGNECERSGVHEMAIK